MRQFRQSIAQLRYMPAALIVTWLALLTLVTRQSIDSGQFADLGLNLQTFQIVYIALSVGLLLLIPFEQRIKTWLQHQRSGAWTIIIAALIISVLSAAFLDPHQDKRLFRSPFSLWVVIVHMISLAGLAVVLVKRHTAIRLDRLQVIALVAVGLVLGGLYIASNGEYMRLIIPDEPIVASIATNYALNNQLSPSFLASPYGVPDPAWGRFYLAMGLWLKLVGDTGLYSLRAFPLLVGGLAVLIFAFTLWRNPTLSTFQKLAALVALLGLSAFVRTTHNTRMDVGLAVYGALALLGFLTFFSAKPGRKRWVILMGLALFIGLESVPTMALIVGFSIGCVLVLRHIRQPGEWHFIVLYTLASGLSLAAYFVGQFWPDLADGYQRYQLFTEFYTNNAALKMMGAPITEIIAQQAERLFGYHLRFNLILSPVEILFITGSMMALWRCRRPEDRWLLLTISLAFVGLHAVLQPTYGYWAIFSPWIAYASARLWATPAARALAAFALIPALAAPMAFDLITATVERENSTEVAESAQIVDWFAPGSTIISESSFWIALHPQYNVIHWSGIGRYGRPRDLNRTETLSVFDPDALIVWTGYENTVAWVEELEDFGDQREITVNNQQYVVFFRQN
jgi:hypothetical protein